MEARRARVATAVAVALVWSAAAATLQDETGRLLLKSGWDPDDCSCAVNHFDYDGSWSHDHLGAKCVR